MWGKEQTIWKHLQTLVPWLHFPYVSLLFTVFAYRGALPVYISVYLVPALIIHRQGLLRRPDLNTILGKSFLGYARSSLFLSVYCASAWMWTCLIFRLFNGCSIPLLAMCTFPTGLALSIEKESRRMEISLYSFACTIESFFTCMTDAGYFTQSKKLKRADVIIFSVNSHHHALLCTGKRCVLQ